MLGFLDCHAARTARNEPKGQGRKVVGVTSKAQTFWGDAFGDTPGPKSPLPGSAPAWKPAMDRLTGMACFVRAVEMGSFATAGRVPSMFARLEGVGADAIATRRGLFPDRA